MSLIDSTAVNGGLGRGGGRDARICRYSRDANVTAVHNTIGELRERAREKHPSRAPDYTRTAADLLDEEEALQCNPELVGSIRVNIRYERRIGWKREKFYRETVQRDETETHPSRD